MAELSKQIESNVLERSLRQRNQIDISFYLTTVACHFDDEYTVLSASAKSLYLELWFSFKSRNYWMHVEAFLKLSTFDYDLITVEKRNWSNAK